MIYIQPYGDCSFLASNYKLSILFAWFCIKYCKNTNGKTISRIFWCCYVQHVRDIHLLRIIERWLNSNWCSFGAQLWFWRSWNDVWMKWITQKHNRCQSYIVLLMFASVTFFVNNDNLKNECRPLTDISINCMEFHTLI